jgi:hypothetical protein
MKVVEQYLEAVGRQLPLRGRQDIKTELRSLLLDEIESKYGSNPTEDQLRQALMSFGSPGTVARRYHSQDAAIAPGLTSFYFFLLKIVLGALAIAFFVIFVLGQVQLELSAASGAGVGLSTVLLGLGRCILNTLNAWLMAVGTISLGFIAATRIGSGKTLDLEDDWKPEALNDIEVGPPSVSMAGCIIGMVLLAVLAVLVNGFPQIMTMAEELFMRSGLGIGHRLDIDRFRLYMHAISVAWMLEFIRYGLLLSRGIETRVAWWLERIAGGLSILVLALLVADSTVYPDYSGLLGFRLLFAILLCINLVEAGGMLWRDIKARVASRQPA